MKEKLLKAVNENNVEAVLMLLKSIHEPDKLEDLIDYQTESEGKSLLYIAAENGSNIITAHLIEAGANVNLMCKFGTTPLYIAAMNGFEKIVKQLLQANAEVNRADKDGTTPLFIAAQQGHENVVQLLLQANAEINRADKDGVTPLFVAAEEGHENVVQLLLQANAEINRADKDGVTPLFIAAHNGHEKVVELLLHAKAKVDQAEEDGYTPLFIAAQNGHEKVVELLLNANADIFETTIDGTPLSIALEKKRIKCIELLLGTGAGLFAMIATAQLPAEVDTTNKVVIGMTSEEGLAITRELPGWERAITTVEELNEAIQNDIELNDLALLRVCHHLLAIQHPASAAIEIIKAKLHNTRSLFNLCLYKLQQPSMRSLFFTHIQLCPEEIQEKFAQVESVFGSLKCN